MATYFISAIDTDTGKTIVTGLIAKYLQDKGESVITQKLAQTGCVGISEDIIKHREIMNIPLSPFDKDGTTCPYVFPFPASPHLAAQLENTEIDIDIINKSTNILEQNFKHVLLEGVGGMYVPITSTYTILDFLEEKKYPIILVTSAKLGSINHTLMSLEIAKKRELNIKGIVYNNFPQTHENISTDSKKVFKQYLQKYFPKAGFTEIPIGYENKSINFSKVLSIQDV